MTEMTLTIAAPDAAGLAAAWEAVTRTGASVVATEPEADAPPVVVPLRKRRAG